MLAFVDSIREIIPYLAVIFVITIIAVTFLQVTRPPAARPEPPLPAPAPAPATAEAKAIPAAAIEKQPAPEIVAVIAAAVATISGGTQRVVSIRHQASFWEKVGRQSVLTSHRIR